MNLSNSIQFYKLCISLKVTNLFSYPVQFCLNTYAVFRLSTNQYCILVDKNPKRSNYSKTNPTIFAKPCSCEYILFRYYQEPS